ncbi:MerR family transcriptional regulator [Antrihabitans stalactiti]|uniref:MerR family transcriptional regulator n=1 Tax=Antrihabitans stalactiti TaxID=2584121 RepID=A0A848KKP1_9NOCA|nr:MerR family transcriptional regulator [Antrihabitans stalactiti]NMN98426.1 MerR family transcriptional regulator [Antrihabitans stalactiti]
MTADVGIGEFARLSHLSVKTLRYYHDIGLLTPAAIDDVSGYRRYATTQVDSAQLIRRLRDLDMPLPEVREVLGAADIEKRNAILRAHLDRMEAELVRTQEVVASLRSLLGPGVAALSVEYRTFDHVQVLAFRDHVARPAVGQWCGEVFPRLYEAAGPTVVGPGGATYSMEFFEEDAGEVVAYVPVAGLPRVPQDLELIELPRGRFAVAAHTGPFESIDRTYGALGSYVAEHDVAEQDPIREIYLVGPNHTADPDSFRTEVCWPIRP